MKSAAVDGRALRWARHRAERRAELVAAAIAAIRRYGNDVNMDQVAAEAGVSKPVLYRYFGDKSELWIAAGQTAAGYVIAAVAPRLADIREERGLVVAAVDAYLSAIEAEPELYLFLLQRAAVPGAGTPVANSAQTLASGLARELDDRLRALGLNAGPAQPWAYGMIGFVQSVGDWWLRQEHPVDRATLTEYVVSALWDGIAGIVPDLARPPRTPAATGSVAGSSAGAGSGDPGAVQEDQQQ